MTRKPSSTRKWSVIVAVIAICFIVGYAIGYLVGKIL